MPIFDEFSVKAESPEGWNPDEAEAKRQLDEFNSNFAPGLVELSDEF